MIQNIGAIVTQITNRIVAIVRIIKSTDAQAWKPIQIQNLFEITDLISSQIKSAQRNQSI